MDLLDVFVILGIEKTKDKTAVKNAYRRQLGSNNPEDNPEGFKRLRQAYEEAMRYADTKDTDDCDEIEDAIESDTTPSGLIVKEFRKIYNSRKLRSNEEVFEEFFKNDIFVSLEYDEECREKILAFMMSHYYFPSGVWKILDKYLHITSDLDRLKEKFPQDYIRFIATKCKNGEEINFDQFEGDDDAEYDEYIHYSEKIYHALSEENVDLAAECLMAAERLLIYHPVMELARAAVLKKQDKVEEGVQILQKIYDKYPEDMTIGYNFAESLWSIEEKDKAAEIYKILVSKNKDYYMANLRLSEWYCDGGEFETAKKHANVVLGYGFDDRYNDILKKINTGLEKQYLENIPKTNNYKDKMELAWCYLQDGKLIEGFKIVNSIKDEVADCDRTEYIGMIAKYYTECALYEDVLDYAKEWIAALNAEKPENYEKKLITGHYLISNALHFLAYNNENMYKMAASELSEMGEILYEDIPSLIKLANIYADAKMIDECAVIAEVLETKGIYVGHIILLEAYEMCRDAAGIIEQSKVVARYFPDYVRAYELAARVFYANDVMNGLKEVLEIAEQNNAKSVILDAFEYLLKNGAPKESIEVQLKRIGEEYIDNLKKTGQMRYFDKALSAMNDCLMQYPSAYMLIERGLLYLEVQKFDEAEQDFLKALEDEPYNRYALSNLACVYRDRGQYDKAYVYYNKANCFTETDYEFSLYNIADIYLRLGEYELANKQYQLIMHKFNKNELNFAGSLISIYKHLGRIDDAVALINKSLKKNSALYFKELLKLYLEIGDEKQAKKIVSSWKIIIQLMNPKTDRKGSCMFYREASWYYLMQKKHDKALEYMRKAMKINEDMNETYYELQEEILFMYFLAGQFDCMYYADNLKDLTGKDALFFDMKKYRKYLYFLEELFSGNRGGAEKILEELDGCAHCTGCRQRGCKEYDIARAMLLEFDGKKNEAIDIYEMLDERHPLDKYIKALLLYKKSVL